MKVLVTGGSGLLGGYIQKELKDRRIEYFAPESHVMNITDELQVSRTISDFKPDVVIHCAAVAKYKIVEEQPMKALRANVLGTINIILLTGMVVYANYKFYNWMHTLNPYDFTSKK